MRLSFADIDANSTAGNGYSSPPCQVQGIGQGNHKCAKLTGTLCCTQVGAMSRIRLSDITNSFVKKLEERVLVRKDSAARPVDVSLLRSQALKLCAGRCVGSAAVACERVVLCAVFSCSAAHQLV